MAVYCRYKTHTSQEPGSLFCCDAVMSLQFAHVRYFTCKGRLRSLRADCSTVSLYCVTITWPQTFKGSLEVAVVLADVLSHVIIERTHLDRQCSKTVTVENGKLRCFILCEMKHE